MEITQLNLTNHSSLQDIGGLAYFLNDMSEYLPTALLCSLGVIFGVLGTYFLLTFSFFGAFYSLIFKYRNFYKGNLVIIGTILANKELQNCTYMLILNLSLADIIISGFVDSLSVVSIFLGKSFFDNKPFLCGFIGFVCLVSCETSLMNIGTLAVNRYVHICHSRYYAKIFNKNKTLLYCAITWSIGVLINVPNLTGRFVCFRLL
jgi:hypothetical protein